MDSRAITTRGADDPAQRLTSAILDIIGRVPDTEQQASDDPLQRARAVAQAAAAKAAVTAGGLALPPGPLGWLTVVPELVAVWRLQAQMVADIAGVYGRKPELRREQMIYCLFRHTAAQALRDLIVRSGERYLVRKASLATLQSVAGKIGLRVTRQAAGKGLSRWIPLVGAVGVGAYAYYDTGQVARTAIALFEGKPEA